MSEEQKDATIEALRKQIEQMKGQRSEMLAEIDAANAKLKEYHDRPAPVYKPFTPNDDLVLMAKELVWAVAEECAKIAVEYDTAWGNPPASLIADAIRERFKT